eukprot:TRINITY_DN8628_c1_g1_i1.p1 TRINITY_DN8628_c1_g1~~TRINITY_DN8628_c1_g1_i1.p1  ORF type:complete len:372 (+),score=109.94 TRINITY_DN8628_c1_g1_i1:582-1697(+)
MANIFASLRRKGGKKRRTVAEADPFPGVSLHILGDGDEEQSKGMPFPGVRLHKRGSSEKKKGGMALAVNGVEEPMRVVLSCGAESVQGPVRPSMEDTVTCLERVSSEVDVEWGGDLAYFGVYDGHSGPEAAKVVQERLHHVICGSMHCREGNLEQALISGFLEMDQEVLRRGVEENWRSGATVTVALVRGSDLYTANVGDSVAVLASTKEDGTWGAEVLSAVHKASVESEKARIKAAGGMVMRGRVYGDLAISRALGDSQYKRPTADGDFVSAVPATRRVKLTPKNPALVLATDGLWDKVSPEETMNLVREKVEADPPITCTDVARQLTELTIERGSGDNVTIIVARFDWKEKSGDDVAGDSGMACTSSAS